MRGLTLIGLALVGTTVASANAPTTTIDEGVPPKAPVASTPTEVGMVHPVAVLMDNGDVVPIPTMAPEYADEEMYGGEFAEGDMAMHFDPYGENTPFPVGDMGPDGYPMGEEPMVEDEESAAQRSMFAKRGYGGYGGYGAGYGAGYGQVYGAGYGTVYPSTIDRVGKMGKTGNNWKLRGKKYGGYNTAQFYRRQPLLNKPIINTPIINKPVINKPIVNRPIFNKPGFPFIPNPLPTIPQLPIEQPLPTLPTLPPMPQIPVNYPATYDVQPAYTYPSYDAVYGQPDCPPGESCGGVVTPMYMPRKSVMTSSGGYTRPSYSKYVH